MKTRAILFIGGLAVLSACSEPPPPRSVDELIENPIVLEAVMVRCAQNRDETRYDAECINARMATDRISAREEAERREAFEAQSERKRQALRRTQAAAAEARRRSAEARRRREEAEYLAQFGELPPGALPEEPPPGTGNEPIAVIPEPQDEQAASDDVVVTFDEPVTQPVPGGNQPAVESENPQDLEDIRDELRRRNEESGD